MPAILAIEPDRRQASRLSALAGGPIRADVLVVSTVNEALTSIAHTVPDLILTPLLLSPRDDAALTARLRELAADGAQVQTLVIPVLASSSERAAPADRGGLLTRLRRPRADAAQPDGCDPMVFAAQVNEYLERVDSDRHDSGESGTQDNGGVPLAVFASAPMLEELLPPSVPLPLPAAHVHVPSKAVEPPVFEATDLPTVMDEPTRAAEPAPLDESRPLAVSLLALAAPLDDDAVAGPALRETPAPNTSAPPEPLETAPDVSEPPAPAADVISVDAELNEVDDENWEWWTPLTVSHEAAMAPLEGPVVRRQGPAPALQNGTPKSAHRSDGRPGTAAERRATRAQSAGKPIQDEWGLYDPEQCGFAALLDRLDAALDGGTDAQEDGDRSVIMPR